MNYERTTVEEVAADPTNAYQVTVHGYVPIRKLTIHENDTGGHGWTHIEYANGGTETGCPQHWHSYVRASEGE